MIGQCSSFNDVRGFGFVSVPDIVNEKARYFVHHSVIQRRCLVTRRVFNNNKELRAHLKTAPFAYNAAKSRLHTGEYVRISVPSDAGPPGLGKSVRALRVMPITDGGTLMCEHIDMSRPPRYVRGPVAPSVYRPEPPPPLPAAAPTSMDVHPEILGSAPEKVTFAQVVLKKRDLASPGGIIKDQDWGDIV